MLGVNLAEAAIDVPVRVCKVGGERAFRRRLMEFGLIAGTRVQVCKVAPLGDPLELALRGCKLSIRANEAAAIEVEPIEDEGNEA